VFYFCDLGNCEILKALLSKGANVDSLSDTGTPLHMAAFFKQDGAMKILLDHGADVCNVIVYLHRLTRSKLLITRFAHPNFPWSLIFC
jgi:ankyrin repeat protein